MREGSRNGAGMDPDSPWTRLPDLAKGPGGLHGSGPGFGGTGLAWVLHGRKGVSKRIPSLLIVADRGCLKRFRLEETPSFGPKAHLLETVRIDAAHGRYRDKFSDQAGAFPTGGTAGQGNSIGERMSLETEEETRIFRRLAAQMSAWLAEHHGAWGFAAPAEINGAVLDELEPHLRERLTINLPSDLIHVEGPRLLQHFTAAA